MVNCKCFIIPSTTLCGSNLCLDATSSSIEEKLDSSVLVMWLLDVVWEALLNKPRIKWCVAGLSMSIVNLVLLDGWINKCIWVVSHINRHLRKSVGNLLLPPQTDTETLLRIVICHREKFSFESFQKEFLKTPKTSFIEWFQTPRHSLWLGKSWIQRYSEVLGCFTFYCHFSSLNSYRKWEEHPSIQPMEIS